MPSVSEFDDPYAFSDNTDMLSNRAKRSFRPLKSPLSRNRLPTHIVRNIPTGRNADNDLPEIRPQIGFLRCQLCHGRRSSLYHKNNSEDPEAFPPEGIYSRRRTKCAANKARLQASHRMLPVIHELPADKMANYMVSLPISSTRSTSQPTIKLTPRQP